MKWKTPGGLARIAGGFLFLLGLLALFLPAGGRLLYLSPLEAPELWMKPALGGRARQLSAARGEVYDFTARPDGSLILYSARGAAGGRNLWLGEPSGGPPRLLLDCAGDACDGAAVSPGGKHAVFTRRSAAAGALPRLWLLDLASRGAAPLFADPEIACEQPAWSPDGLYLSCYDARAEVLRLHPLSDPSGASDMLFPTPSTQPGSWLPDGSGLLFTRVESGLDAPLARLLLARLDGSARVLPVPLDAIDFSPPAVSPDGNWAAMSALRPGGGAGRDLYLLRLEGSQAGQVVPLEEDALLSTTACRWSPAGELLACQQYDGSGASVVIWDTRLKTSTVLAENAALPLWVR